MTSDSLTFSISTTGPPPVASSEYVAVRVSNLGNALVAVAGEPGRRLRLLPAIWSVTPSRGSRAGGTTVTLTGSGLTPRADSVMVRIKSCGQTHTHTNDLSKLSEKYSKKVER